MLSTVLIFLSISLFGLVAGTFSGIVGTGSSLILMPVLVILFGPKQAVPIMAVAAILGNLARIAVWWRDVDWRACAVYSLTGIPAAALGARTLLALPPRLIEGGLGLFFLTMIPVRHWLLKHQFRLHLWHLAVAGGAIGYLTGIVVTTGPINVPIFLSYGLIKGPFLATEAASSLAVYLSKAVTFRTFGALPWVSVAKGCFVGFSLMIGQVLAKHFVLKFSDKIFRRMMDLLMLVSGLALLGAAWVRG